MAKKKRKLVLLSSLAISSLLLWILWTPLRIHFHRDGVERTYYLMVAEYDQSGRVIQRQQSAFESLRNEIMGLPKEPWERCEYHRDELVRLGHLEHRQFRFKHIQASTPQARKLWKLMIKELPTNIHMTGTTGSQPFIVDVYETPDNIPPWEAFVSKHDVPQTASE